MNPLSPITAEATTGCDSAAGATAPPSPWSPPRFHRSPRPFKVIAAKLDCSPRQAEILVAIASGCADRPAICRAIGVTDECLRVHVSNLRRQHWAIYTRRRISYYLSPEHRDVVARACGSDAPSPVHGPHGPVSSQTGRGANAPASFSTRENHAARGGGEHSK